MLLKAKKIYRKEDILKINKINLEKQFKIIYYDLETFLSLLQ